MANFDENNDNNILDQIGNKTNVPEKTSIEDNTPVELTDNISNNAHNVNEENEILEQPEKVSHDGDENPAPTDDINNMETDIDTGDDCPQSIVDDQGQPNTSSIPNSSTSSGEDNIDTGNTHVEENNISEQASDIHDDSENVGEKSPARKDTADANDNNTDHDGISRSGFVPFSCDDLIDDTDDEGENTSSEETQKTDHEQDTPDQIVPDDPEESAEPPSSITKPLNDLGDTCRDKNGGIPGRRTGRGDSPRRTKKDSRRTIIVGILLPIIAVIVCFGIAILALNNLMFTPGYLDSDDELLSVDPNGECGISVTVEADGIKDDDMPFLVRIYGVDDENIYGYTDTTYTTLVAYAGETITSTMESGEYTVEIVGVPMRVDGTIYSVGDSKTCTLSVGGGNVEVTLSSEEDDENWDVRGVIRNYNLYITADIDGLDLDTLREATLAVCEALDSDFEVDGEEKYELTDEEIQSIIDELYAEAEAAGIANAKNKASSGSASSEASSGTSGSGSGSGASSGSSSDGSTSSGDASGNISGNTSSGDSGHSNTGDESSGNTEGGNSTDSDGSAGTAD